MSDERDENEGQSGYDSLPIGDGPDDPFESELQRIMTTLRGEPDQGRYRIKWRPLRREISMNITRAALFDLENRIDPLVAVGGLISWVRHEHPSTPAEIKAVRRFGPGWEMPKALFRASKGLLAERIDREIEFYKDEFRLAPAVRGEEPDRAQAELLPDRGRPSQEVLAQMFADQETRQLRPGERTVQVVPVPIPAPPFVVETLAGELQFDAPACVGVQRCALIDSDGHILAAKGYHPESGIYFDLSELHVLTDDITLDEMKASMTWLREVLFAEFPFETEADASIAILAILTGIQRRLMKICPAFLFTAPIQSSGKTALADLVSGIVMGNPVAASGWASKEEEMQKWILSILVKGQQIVSIDNLPAGKQLESNSLAKALTSAKYEGRILGESRSVTVPSLSTFLATGNNVVMKGDLATRFLTCRIDAQLERPEGRKFNRNLYQWMLDNREIALFHCYTVLSGGIRMLKAGTPRPEISNKRFPEWCELVLYPAMLAGLHPIEEAIERQRLQDEDGSAIREFVEAWFDFYQQKPIARSLRDLINEVYSSIPRTTDEDGWKRLNDETKSEDNRRAIRLLAAIEDLVPKGAVTPKALSYVLRSYKGRVFGDLIINTKDHCDGLKWYVKSMTSDLEPLDAAMF